MRKNSTLKKRTTKKAYVPKPKRLKRNPESMLSKVNTETANAIFHLHDLQTADFTSVFIIMLLDLYNMFPTLPCFVEEREWLSWIGRPLAQAMSYGTIMDCAPFASRLSTLLQSTHAYGERDSGGYICPLGLTTNRMAFREVFSPEFPFNDSIKEGDAGFSALKLERGLLEDGTYMIMTQNNFKRHVPLKLGAEVLFVPLEWVDRPTALYRPALTLDASEVTQLACNSIFLEHQKHTIVQVSAPTGPLGIHFREALWLVQKCKCLKVAMLQKFMRLWERVLIPSKQWRAALCLLSAVKISTFSKYLGHLRQLLLFVNLWFLKPIKHSMNMETLVDLIKRDDLDEEVLIQFAQYRTNRIKF